MNESEKNLRLLREYVVVSLQEYDSDDNKVGDPVRKTIHSELDAEELAWRIDKYGRPDWKSTQKYLKNGPVLTSTGVAHASRDPFGKLKSSDRQTAIKSIDELIDRLVELNEKLDGGTKFTRQQLIDVILPWGEVGFDALRRIYIVSNRTKRVFPFFSNRRALGPISSVKKLPFPSSPTTELCDWLLDQKTRIGSSDTGKGEFLLSLLTGATPTYDHPGDLKTTSGRRWEVKDVRSSGGAARLGDVDSDQFAQEMKKFYGDSDSGMSYEKFAQKYAQNVLFSIFGVAPVQPTRVEEPGESQEDAEETTPKDTQVTHGNGGSAKLEGFVVITDDGFNLVPLANLRYAWSNKRGRVHVKFEGI